MTCYRPMKAFIVGVNEETCKKVLKIKPYEIQYLYKISGENENKYHVSKVSLCPNSRECPEKVCDYSCLHEHLPSWAVVDAVRATTKEPVYQVYYEFITIPCGNCVGCRIDKSKEWANRLMLELTYSSESWFATLTFDEEHVPRSKYETLDEVTGEVVEHESKTLSTYIWQCFMKRLRKRYGKGIRFYACGEYGDRTFRPHYHAIFFNLHLEDAVPYQRTRDGFYLYWSEELERIWSNGRVLVADVNMKTCAYVTRYVTKKFGVAERWKYEYFNIEPEKALMSRRPGIGRMWYDEHKDDVYRTHIIVFGDKYRGYKFRPPKYFDNLYSLEDSETVEMFKEMSKKAARNNIELSLKDTDLSYLEYLEVSEDNFLDKVKRLERGDV